jgi:DNA repair exonuclease SbcCD nuclease subunit
MKFIHIADVHLGAEPDAGMPWGAERKKEIWESFRRVLEACNEHRVDLLLIAGDLFHRQPLVKELKEVNYCFGKLTTAQVVLMAGNHDYIGVRSYYQDFIWEERVHMFLGDTPDRIVLPELNTEIYGFSYCKRDISEPLYDHLKPMNRDRINILLAHGGDERDIPINRRRIAEAGFDYVALGHIHKPELISQNMAYSGSLEPLDKNETGERGYILGEITEDFSGGRQTKINFIPSSLREYKYITLPVTPDTTNGALLDQAREAIMQKGSRHIYRILLQGMRDESIQFDQQAICQLGNVIEITDQSVPDYDFDVLYRENEDNIIGQFIRRIRESEKQDEVTRKALYYGIEALLGAKKN